MAIKCPYILSKNESTCTVFNFNRKNGEIDQETTDRGYTLTFQCRQEVLGDVMEKLNVIRDSIISVSVDLNKEFPLYAGNYWLNTSFK